MTKQFDPQIGGSVSPDELRAAMLAGMKSMVTQALKNTYKEVDSEGTEIDPQMQARQREFDDEMAGIVKTVDTMINRDKATLAKTVSGLKALRALMGQVHTIANEYMKTRNDLNQQIVDAYKEHKDVDPRSASQATQATQRLGQFLFLKSQLDDVLNPQGGYGIDDVIATLEEAVKDIS